MVYVYRVDHVFGDITVACTNTDRIVFPDSGITKGDVIAYYRDVAEVMVPELRGRPLTIERFTKGIDKGGFFQCDRMSRLLCMRHPEMLTTEFYKKDRKNRLYLDTMRNSLGATIVAPYSLRARPGAPVSTPIGWDEVATITPDGIRLRDVRARLDRRGAPWNNLRTTLGSAAAAARSLDHLTGP